jgi:hypothetical protein
LEDRLVQYADLPWFSRHTYHAIGKHNNKGQHMIHRAYICGNLKSPFVLQNYDQLEGCHTTKIVIPCSSSFVFKKSIPALSFVSTNLVQDRVGNNRVHSDPEAYMLAEIFERDDKLETWKHGQIPHHKIFRFPLFSQPCSPLCCAGSV